MDDLLCTESVSSQGSLLLTGEGGPSSNIIDPVLPLCPYDEAIYSDSRVLDNLLVAQLNNLPSALYLQPNKSHVNPHIRNILVHWMSELCEHRHCEDQVFIVAVNLLDRFLSTTAIQRTQLQLSACVCLLIASKIRQSNYLNVELLAFYTEDSVSHAEIRQWEVLVLAKLGWEVCPVTSIDFIEPLLSLFPQLDRIDGVRRHALTYITLVATEGESVSQLPSTVAAAAVSVAMEGHGVFLPGSLQTLTSSLKCSAQDIQSSRNLIELSISRYSEYENRVNNNNNEADDDNHFLGESKMSVDTNNKIDGKVTPTDIQDVHF